MAEKDIVREEIEWLRDFIKRHWLEPSEKSELTGRVVRLLDRLAELQEEEKNGGGTESPEGAKKADEEGA